MNVMVFDIETVPDITSGQRLYDLEGLSAGDTGKAMAQLRTAKTGHDFLAHHLQRIVAISVVYRHMDTVKVCSLGEGDSSEGEILQHFYAGIERDTPTLVSWNGAGFVMPVLHYRTLLQGVQAARYWETQEDDLSSGSNGLLSNSQRRHIDLMNVIAGFQAQAISPLDEIATMLGYPGKMGASGTKVWDDYQTGGIESIRNHCDMDVLNIYLVYLRFELMRGRLNKTSFAAEEELLRAMLVSSDKQHLADFLKAWKNG